MQGLFFDAPLIGVLELLHVSRKTGVLTADAELPFFLDFQDGQITNGGIVDWQGLDAIYAAPLLPEQGSFSFRVQDVSGEVLAPYGKITADWARYSDDWSQMCAVIGSPSALFRGDLPLFDDAEGRSVRAAAQSAQLPLFEVAERVVAGIRSGRLFPMDRSAWYALKLRHQLGSGRGGRVAAALNGEKTMGDLLAEGFTVAELRDYLIFEIRAGLRFPGCGWVLRDLVWEKQHAARP
ncbi:DUF4388 domain-containing protein [Deinococcus aquiradiocola]|uniref:PatA-like N-terminal domain-containing protein n=1 Tax=Deinococcus aquiradiocola TaxID=393059 RepID=A0A917PEC2_9DEIO|nr:DUF4388 domain-containing protein [Deinococcus aquiradiocola]GGJ72425.1 hypothetical protein GCM10008939_16030 [Deinococcus aquiradiocola]